MAPTPFTIRLPDATLADLRERLDRIRWPDEIPSAGWQYGTDLTYLRQLVDYWRTQYDWCVHEARLNAVSDHGVEGTGRSSCCVSQLRSGFSPLNRQATASTNNGNVGRPRI